MTAQRVLARLALAIIRMLLRAYPAAFRAGYREAVLRDVRSDLDAAGTAWRTAVTASTAVLDAARGLAGERLASIGSRPGPHGGMMRGFTTDVRLAARRIRLQPLGSATVVLTVALAIGASTAIFSVVDGVMLKPLPFPASERLVRLHEDSPAESRGDASLTAIEIWMNEVASVESLAFFERRTAVLLVNDEPDRVTGAMVSRNFPAVLRVAPALGRTFQPEPLFGGPAEVLISHRLWQRLGGNPDVIGRPLSVDPRMYSIVGVMPAGFSYPEDADWWTTLPADLADVRTFREARFLTTVGRLREGASVASLEAELALLTERYPARDKQKGEVRMRGVGLRDYVIGQTRRGITVVAVAAGLLLVIACCNIAALLLARAVARHQESAVQAALGATRGRLLRQSAAEVMLLTVVGGMIGVLAAVACRDAIVALSVDEVPRIAGIAIDLRALAFGFAATVATGALAMLLPAWAVSRGALGDGLRAARGERVGPSVLPVLRALVVAEVALTFIMGTSAVLLGRTFDRLTRVDPGFSPERVLATRVYIPISRSLSKPAQVAFYEDMTRRVGAIPGVESVALATRLPLADALPSADVSVPESGQPSTRVFLQQVSPGFLSTIGARLAEGREIADTDGPAAPAAVINTLLARQLFGDQPAVGRRLRVQHMTMVTAEIVGVSEPIRVNGLTSTPAPEVYLDYRVRPMPLMLLARVSGAPEALMPAIKAAVRQADPTGRMTVGEMTTLEREVARRLARPRFFLALVGTFGIVALVLAAAGLYSMLAFAVTQRRHELGVRLALGATPRDLFHDVARRGVALAGIGVLVGAAGAFAVSRGMESVLFGVDPWDPATFGVTGAFIAAVALLASWLPARRAQRTDPLEVLRTT